LSGNVERARCLGASRGLGLPGTEFFPRWITTNRMHTEMEPEKDTGKIEEKERVVQ
jgi:hypothetical protein